MDNLARIKYEEDKKALMNGAVSLIYAAYAIEHKEKIKLFEDAYVTYKKFIEIDRKKPGIVRNLVTTIISKVILKVDEAQVGRIYKLLGNF
jgi:hypothetical protein